MISNSPNIRRRDLEPTRNLSADEEGEDEERIVEGYADVFWVVGLKSDGGVNAACPSSHICGYEIIYALLVLFSKPTNLDTVGVLTWIGGWVGNRTNL